VTVVLRSLEDVPRAPEGRSLALGTFDGVHRGHRQVIEVARTWAGAHGTRSSVVTFDPHPLRVLRPDDAPRLLTTTDVKVSLLEALELDEVVVIPFTRELSLLEPDAFCREVLAERLQARLVSVGENFRFGHGAAGDAAFLRSRPEFETDVVPLVELGGETVSSSRIRELIESGAVSAAAELLGAPFQLDGSVIEGDARGRELGVPTANLSTHPDVVVPGAGIYAARALLDGREVPAAVSIGVRPTFEDSGELRVEAHLIGFEGDLYGRELRLVFIERMRDEERFESAEALVEQIRKDVEETLRIVGRGSRFST
jgi:riboflavin kinase/FMN adenylyltransferase